MKQIAIKSVNPFLPFAPNIPPLSLQKRMQERYYPDKHAPQLTLSFSKLQSIPSTSIAGVESSEVSGIVRNQGKQLALQSIPVIPNHSFETGSVSCRHGTCVKIN